MIKYQKTTTIITLLLILGFFITFHNTTDETMIYRLKWIDHNFNSPFAVNMMVGEIGPGKKLSNSEPYPAGTWSVSWEGVDGVIPYEQTEIILILPNITDVLSEPEKKCVQTIKEVTE